MGKTTKIYHSCDDKDYILGEIGDYLVVPIGHEQEKKVIHVIRREQFLNSYEEVKLE